MLSLTVIAAPPAFDATRKAASSLFLNFSKVAVPRKAQNMGEEARMNVINSMTEQAPLSEVGETVGVWHQFWKLVTEQVQGGYFAALRSIVTNSSGGTIVICFTTASSPSLLLFLNHRIPYSANKQSYTYNQTCLTLKYSKAGPLTTRSASRATLRKLSTSQRCAAEYSNISLELITDEPLCPDRLGPRTTLTSKSR